MPLINVTMQHGRTLQEAKARLEAAVQQATGQFGALVRHVQWNEERDRVRLDGTGFWAELWVDPTLVHATGDVPVLGALLGGQVAAGLKRILEQAFQKKLP